MEKLKNGSTITLQIVSKPEKKEPTKINCSLEENYDKNECLLPDMVGWTYSKYKNWVSALSNISIMIDEKAITITDPLDTTKAGTIHSQSVEPGTPLNEVNVLIIEYYKELNEENIENEDKIAKE